MKKIKNYQKPIFYVCLILFYFFSFPTCSHKQKKQVVLEKSDLISPATGLKGMVVGMEVGPTGQAFADKNFMANHTGQEIVQNAVKAGVQYLVVWSKDDYYAFYNSKIRPKPTSMKDRDFLQECIDEAEIHNLPIIVYLGVQYDQVMWKEHPDWRMKDENGKDIGRMYLASPGYLEYIKKIIDELAKYDIVGIHFDMLDMGFNAPYGSWSKVAIDSYKEKYGTTIPKMDWDSPDWDKANSFRYATNACVEKELEAYTKKVNPKFIVDFNYHGQPPFSFEVGERPVEQAAQGDFVTAETLPFKFGYTNISLLCHFMQGVRPDGLIQAVGSRSIRNYHDYTVRPIEDMRFEVMNSLSHGAIYTLVDKLGYDGSTDHVVYDRIGDVFDEAKRKAKYCFGYNKILDCGVYYSARTRDFYARFNAQKYLGAIMGIHKALVEAHLTYGFVFDESVTLSKLKQFPLMILPSTAIINNEEAELFRQYVREGGNLFAIGPVGIYDKFGRITYKCTISDIIGATFKGVKEDFNDTFIRFPGKVNSEFPQLNAGIPLVWDMFVEGELYEFAPTTAKTYADLCAGFNYENYPPKEQSLSTDLKKYEQRVSAGKVVSPAIFENRFGKGTVILIPCRIDWAYIGGYRMPEHRILIANVVKSLLPAREIIVKAPLNTEIVKSKDSSGNKILVHLITYNGTIPSTDAGRLGSGVKVYPPLMEEPATYSVEITVNRPFKKVTSVDGTSIEINNRKISFTTFQVCEIVIIE